MRKALIAVLVLAVLGGALLLAATLMIDREQLKALLIRQVEERTGRDLVIDGEIGWTLYPSLGLSLGPVQLKNPTGFPEGNTLAFDSASMQVGLLPLFSHRVEAGEIRLRGLQLHLLTRKDGVNNLDDLLHSTKAAPGDESTATAPAKDSAEQAAGLAFSLAGIRLEQANLWLDNQQTGSQMRIEQLNLTTGPLAFDRPISLSLDGVLKLADLSSQFSTQGELRIPASRDGLSLDQWQLETELSGAKWQAHLNSSGNLQVPAGDAPLRLQGWQLDGTYSAGDLSAQLKSQGEISLSRSLDSVQLANWLLEGELKTADLTSRLNSRATLSANLASGRERVELQGWHADIGLQGQAVPPGLRQLSLDGVLSHQLANRLTELKGLRLHGDGLQADGELSLQQGKVPRLSFDLRSPLLDLDRLRGLSAIQPTSTAAGKSAAPAKAAAPASTKESPPATEPDLRGLKAFDLAGQWQIGEFRSAPLNVRDLLLRVSSQEGRFDITRIEGRTYQGQVALSGQLDASQYPASFKLAPVISGVQIQPLLRDFTGKEPLSGTASLKGQLSGRGLTGPAIRQSLTGKLAMQVQDGAVNGVNVAALIRKAMAKVKGEPYQEEVQRTDFSALTADFILSQGRATSDNIAMQSPLLRIQGRGTTHLQEETLDFGFQTSVVGSLKGQGGEDLSELKNLTLPLTIRGTWSQPKFGLDVESLLRDKLQQKLEKKLEQKVQPKLQQLDDKLQQKLQGKLGKLFG